MQSRKWRNTWSNRQIWPWSTKWSRSKGYRVLSGDQNGHSKHPLPTIQEMTLYMDIARWSILKSDWLYSLQPKIEKLYTVSKTRPGADCGSDHELLIAKFRLKLKKVGKITRPFRYDLNQIPYDYTVEVINRFKGCYLIDSVWRTVGGGSHHCPGGSDQNHLRKKKKKYKMVNLLVYLLLVWGGFTNSRGKKRSERQGRKGKIPNWMQSSRE